MGLTTASTHLHAPALPAAVVADSLRALVTGPGEWVEDPGSAFRVLVVLPPDGCPWFSIYDTGEFSAEEIARELSRKLAVAAVAVAVEDSDRCSATLYARGKRVDRLAASVLRRQGSGHPGKWEQTLPQVSAAELREGIAGGMTFAEDALRRMAQALGLPAKRVLALPDELAAQPPESAARLAFRPARASVPAPGAPALIQGSVQAVPCVAGQPIYTLMAQVANRGAGTRGIRVVLSGPAVEEGLLSPEAIRFIRIGKTPDGMPGQEVLDSPVEAAAGGLAATLPAAVLPYQEAPEQLGSGRGAMQRMEEWLRKPAWISVQGRALRAGQSTLRMRVECLEAPGVALETELPVTVHPAA